MTRIQEEKLNMMVRVLSFSAVNTDATDLVPAYGTTITELTAIVGDINETDQEVKDKVTTGLTANKDQLKDQLADATSTIAKAIYSYSFATGNLDLQAKVNISLSELKSEEDGNLPNISMNVYTLANDNITSLVPYGVVAADLTALETLITNFLAKIALPKTTRAGRKVNVQQQKQNFKSASVLLRNRLDKIAGLVATKANLPGFLQEYMANRKLNNLTRHTQVSGIITDASTGLPVAGVTVMVAGSNYKPVTSDENGEYSLLTPKFRNLYILLFSKMGYDTKQTPNLVVRKGKMTSLDIQLVPIS